MKPKELKVGDKVFLVKEESFLSPSKELGVVEVTRVTGSSIYVDNTRFPIKATFPLVHKSSSLVDRTQHIWLNEEDYLEYLSELRKAKESRVTVALRQVTEGLRGLSDEQLDKLTKELKRALVSLNTKKEGNNNG